MLEYNVPAVSCVALHCESGSTEQGPSTAHTQTLCVTHLEDGEVLEYTVHHVFLWEVFQSVDEADHVITHGRAIDAEHKPSIVKP